MRARIAIGFGIVLLLASTFAALRTSSIFYAEFPTGVEATFDCGSAVVRAEVKGDLAEQVGVQRLCDEQHLIYTVISIAALVLGGAAIVYGSRRRPNAGQVGAEVASTITSA